MNKELEDQIKAQADVLAPSDVLVTALRKAGFTIGVGKPPTKEQLVEALASVGVYVQGDLREANMPEEVQMCTCLNCDWHGPDTATNEIKDVMMRVAPGEPMPVGECPDCGALVHLPKAGEDILNDIIKTGHEAEAVIPNPDETLKSDT